LRAQGHPDGPVADGRAANRHDQHGAALPLAELRRHRPRYWADFIVFDDLKKLVVRQTYKKGILVAEEGKYLARSARWCRGRAAL